MSPSPNVDDLFFMRSIFEEPEGYYEKKPESHFTEYVRENISEVSKSKKRVLPIRLVGSSPLWGHILWNSAVYTAMYIDKHPDEFIKKCVLELGAAGALPSIVAGLVGAKKVVSTDYPDANLIDNIQYNVDQIVFDGDELSKVEAEREKQLRDRNIVVESYIWGNDYKKLVSHLPGVQEKFDFIILSDLIFNHIEHRKLLRTTKDLLAKDGRALVVFSPHRPWLINDDLRFFETAVDYGLKSKLIELINWKPMFEKDPGPEEIRGRVYAYHLFHE